MIRLKFRFIIPLFCTNLLCPPFIFNLGQLHESINNDTDQAFLEKCTCDNINQRDISNYESYIPIYETPLIHAAKRINTVTKFELLIKLGADPYVYNSHLDATAFTFFSRIHSATPFDENSAKKLISDVINEQDKLKRNSNSMGFNFLPLLTYNAINRLSFLSTVKNKNKRHIDSQSYYSWIAEALAQRIALNFLGKYSVIRKKHLEECLTKTEHIYQGMQLFKFLDEIYNNPKINEMIYSYVIDSNNKTTFKDLVEKQILELKQQEVDTNTEISKPRVKRVCKDFHTIY